MADAGIAYFSFNVSAFELPFAFSEKRNLYKLFMLDTGLLSHMCLRDILFPVLNGEIDINEGALTENFVATELVKHGISLNYYDKKSRQELDFIFPERNRISVIEVKSGNSHTRHASLNAVRTAYPDRIHRSIVLSKFNVRRVETSGSDATHRTDEVLYYPLYMTMFV
ncbi:MAG: DUF4143 domain-containing protein [Bacteroidales bacterium]|nr:DUF4143 domain-containing protein [Bacteroidales bacterium]